ncbi:UDP-N-acetylglucosamine 2-epimerase (hydrolyzing) [Ruminococcus sp. OM06-36AC]|nr:UDP-N-acetylglucosamine 2-epimerase (hydrolyzing) [Clostridium sp.]RGM77625.1 UDP-N-acetylglucosamine 2-epimerase (hydrolyzing) [Ruminococcus sp. OM06-36AC]
MVMHKVAFVTGSRADYGIMRNYLKLMHEDETFDLKILATGALLDNTYGHQVDLIYQDGFDVAVEIPIDLDSSSNCTILHSMSIALDCFADYFSKVSYDLLIILGDRFEMLPVAIAASMQKIPILHVHGGEATFANYDEFIRHAITKMSLFHFTSTEEYRRRVIQLGEDPERVFNLGALGAENCLYIDEKNVPQEIIDLPEKQYFVVLFHPETLTTSSEAEQVTELLSAICRKSTYKYVFIGSNADTNSNIIRDKIKKYVEEHDNADYYENLHTDAYHYLVKHSVCLIGNSSSGIIEAPSLGVYTINIGKRQDGRVRGNSIIDVECDAKKIEDAMAHVLTIKGNAFPINPYYQENSAQKYYKATQTILSKLLRIYGQKPKIFYDISF